MVCVHGLNVFLKMPNAAGPGQTKMTSPERAERHWLCIAVATLWLVSVGGQADTKLSSSSLPDLSVEHTEQKSEHSPSVTRKVSCFRRGIITLSSICAE